MQALMYGYLDAMKDNEKHPKYMSLFVTSLVKWCCTVPGVKEWVHERQREFEWVLEWIHSNPNPN